MPDRIVKPKWWISNGERPDGPYDVDIVRERIRTRELFPDNLACPVGGEEWRPLRDWKEVFADAISVAVSRLPPPPPINTTDDRFQVRSAPEELTLQPGRERRPISENTEGQPITSSEPYPNIAYGADVAFEPYLQNLQDLKKYVKSGWILYLLIMVPFFLPDFGSTPGSPWFLAIIATIIGGILFSVLIQPQENDYGIGISVFVFTFIIAIPLLFFFQEMASKYAGTPFTEVMQSGGGRFKLFMCLTWLIGNGYNQISPEDMGASLPFFYHLVAMFSSVALCEEVLKLIPVLYVAKHTVGDWKQRCLFVGAMSGLGFGVVEGVLYHSQVYQPQAMSLSIYLIRFFSVATLHGCWTIISAACFYHLIENPDDNTHKPPEDIFECTFLILVSVISSMILHSLYNVLVTWSLFLGLLVAWLTVFITVRVFDARSELQNLPCTDSTGTK
ncbi:hypothetical protein V6x_51970 [Gimesia chilikensis]|uniref:PrsW family intramembrane metalloprotease n=2 Tax=Gimesia TaxID=1649453 RepID=A0A6I6AE41_9PLAN|nr:MULTISPECIES: PrsW family glutamic-type intramembrane protease [Gimesia]QDU05460.1 hypothetical protein V6x_51970 [Gimesia chilikensis]QGQ24703.1 PrsW family intramembrane metalloprotease [Gimesia benthica]